MQVVTKRTQNVSCLHQQEKFLAKQLLAEVERRLLRSVSKMTKHESIIIVKNIATRVKSELIKLCSDPVSSVLQQVDKKSITEFSFDAFLTELKTHSPILLNILQQCTTTKVPRSNRTHVIGMCVAILCKLRNPRMCLFHKIVSLILYSGHCSKPVSKIMT